MREKQRYEKILIATSNQGKVVEISSMLAGCATEFIDLHKFPDVKEPVEDGRTFAENALIKARYYAASLALPAVADDSGLMVDALDGAPGVFSSRLVPPGTPDSKRNERLLDMMKNIRDPEKRSAMFVCAAAFVHPESGLEFVEQGELSGRIAFEQSGNAGFGFDPIFIPDGHRDTVASLGLEVKNRISHRRKAFEKLALRIAAR